MAALKMFESSLFMKWNVLANRLARKMTQLDIYKEWLFFVPSANCNICNDANVCNSIAYDPKIYPSRSTSSAGHGPFEQLISGSNYVNNNQGIMTQVLLGPRL